MSHRVKPALAVEWSPRYVRVLDGATQQVQTGEELRQISGFSGKTAIIGIARRALFVRTTRVPNTDLTTIRQILLMRTAELFPVAPGEVVFDFILLDDTNMEGRLALIAAIPTGELRKITEDAREAGIRVERIVPVALGSAFMAKAQHSPDAVIVSREGSGYGIDVVVNGELRHSRSVAAGASLPSEAARTATIGELTGGATLVAKGVDYPEDGVRSSSEPLESLLQDWPEKWHLNLELPEVIAARQKAEVRGKMRNSMFLAAAAAMLLLFVGNDYVEKTEKVRVATAREEAPLRKLKAIQKESETRALTAQTHLKVLDKAFKPAQRLGDVLAVVSNKMPEQAWLSGMSVERGKPIILRGSALPGEAVTNFMNQMNAEKRFRDVQLVFANDAVIEEKPVVQFSVSAFPVGNVTIVEKTKNSRRTASR